jgi:CheY-like chemotaxis protein
MRDIMPAEPKVNILIVDDRPENLLALEGVLDNPTYQLVKATSGREALRCLLDQDFALILLDVQMPGMDGFETARLIKQRERTQDIPIIFVTAISKDDKYIAEGYSTGAVDYLVKPYDPTVLKSKVAVFADLFNKNRRLREMMDQEARVLEQLSRPAATSLTANLLGIRTLRQSHPDIFLELSQKYGALLDQALDQQAFKVDHNIPARLREVAETLGCLKAGPRDVVELHSAALRIKTKEVNPKKLGAFVEAGRLLILELMGHLVSFYRH